MSASLRRTQQALREIHNIFPDDVKPTSALHAIEAKLGILYLEKARHGGGQEAIDLLAELHSDIRATRGLLPAASYLAVPGCG